MSPKISEGTGSSETAEKGSGGRDVVISSEQPRGVRDQIFSTTLPTLTKENYPSWSVKMEVLLEAQGLWEVVESGSTDRRKDRLAVSALFSSIDEQTLLQLDRKKSAKELWESIRMMNQGAPRVIKAKLQLLTREFELLVMKEEESVVDFSGKISRLVNQIRSLGGSLDEEAVVAKLLRAVPEKFDHLVSSMELYGKVEAMTLEEVVGSLRIHEEKIRDRQYQKTEQVFFMKGGSKAVNSSQSGQNSSGSSRGKMKSKWQGHSGSQGSSEGHKKKDKSKIKCFKCQKLGHYASECWGEKKERSLVAEESGEQSSTLLMTQEEETLLVGSTGMDGDQSRRWYLDTGATSHMTGNRGLIQDMREHSGTVSFGDGSEVEVKGKGTLLVTTRQGVKQLTGVLFIPKLRSNILSLGQLVEQGYVVEFDQNLMKIHDDKGQMVAVVERSPRRLYVLELDVRQECMLATRRDEATVWHERYGHLNFHSLIELSAQQRVKGMPRLSKPETMCTCCVAAKHARAPFQKQANFRASEQLELVHADLCGPISPATLGGNQYFLLVVDDHTRLMWTALLKQKSGALRAFRKFKVAAELESGRRLQVLRTDRGGEFRSAEFTRFCDEEGIRRHFTAPYTPQQNGVVERRNRTVMEMVRSLLKARSLPQQFWGEAVNTAVYLLNRSPTHSLQGSTPHEEWTGKKPSVHHLKVFGCVAHVKNVGTHLKKLDDRSQKMIFIGYELGSKAYRFYNPDA